MQTTLDIRTLILMVTLLLACRAAAMGYVWYVARQYAPVRYWAAGSILMATGALFVGLRDVIPLMLSVTLAQALLIAGWLVIDAGIVVAAGERPPWRAGISIAAAAVLLTGWTLVGVPDFTLRTVFNSLPGIIFDCYTAFVCLRSRRGRSRPTLLLLAALLVLVTGTNLLKASFIFGNDIQGLFFQAWQIAQFYIVSIASILLSAALFTLMAAQSLQEQLDREIGERSRINSELGEALTLAERFRTALDKVPIYVYMKDLDSRYTYANQATLELFRCTAEELPGSLDSRFFPAETCQRLRQIDQVVLSGQSTREEVEIPDIWGVNRVYLEVKSPIFSDRESNQVIGLCGISSDITAMKAQERNLEFVAHYDALTKLPNRVLLADRLGQALAQAGRRETAVAVAFLDLDGFKSVNDTYGHDVGDGLLVGLANRMQEALRQGDTLARLGGDEFVAVITDLEKASDCDPVLERLLNAAADVIVVNGISLQVSASIGVTLYPEDESEADLLLRHADQAMYCAKKDGKNRFRRFGPGIGPADRPDNPKP